MLFLPQVIRVANTTAALSSKYISSSSLTTPDHFSCMLFRLDCKAFHFFLVLDDPKLLVACSTDHATLICLPAWAGGIVIILGTVTSKAKSTRSVVFAIVTSVIVTLFGLNASNFLLGVMGSDASGITLTREYLDIIFYGTFIVMIQISLNGTLNAQGDTKSYRNVLIFSFFLNIILNPIFIWGYGFIPAFGIGGLAIATVISQLIGTVYLAYKVNSCKLRKYLYIQCFIPKYALMRDLLSQAVPIMFSMLFIGVGIFNILYFIGQFGELATAGYGAALRVEQVFLLPVIGLNTAVLSIGGQNFGAKAFYRIKELYYKALLFGCSFMAIAGIILFFGAEFFVSKFTNNSEAIYHGAIYLKIAALIGPIYPVFFITTAVFQALKKSIYSLYLSILRLTAFPFLSLWYVINVRGGNYNDIFYTIMATNWLMGLAVLFFIPFFFRKKLRISFKKLFVF